MAVRMVIGRAGTGKTTLCAREIRAAMTADPLGPPLLWLTPEQGTFAAERLLLAGDGAAGRGTFRAQVLSLRRLALLIARDSGLLREAAGAGGGGAGGAKPLDETARIVLLEEMVRQERGRLSVFASVADRPGFIQKLETTLRELRQHGHSGASLRALLEDRPAGALDAVMRRKLLDLAVLLEAWSKVVERPDAWDFEYLMHQAALAMDHSPLLAGARVWVDAISALTTLEIRMLVGMGLHARDLTITLLADPDAPAIRDLRMPLPGQTENVGLFSRTERLYLRLIDAFRQHGVAMGETTALRQAYRFANSAVGRVEAELLEPDARPQANPPAAAPSDADPADKTGVEIWESSDPETEVRMAAQAIREMAVAAGSPASRLRYRQIAVIVPELDNDAAGAGGYQDALRRVFAEHGIPHFIDARRSIAHHPLVELLRSAVALVTSHFDRDDLLLFLKTQLTGVGDDDVALVENYAIEHGISHAPWDQPWTWIAPNQQAEDADEWVPASAHERLTRVNEIRVRVWAALHGFVTGVTAASDDAARFPRALGDLLSTLGVEKRMQAWRDAAQARGDAELAQVHEQVWRQVRQLLALLGTLLAGHPRTLAEFERLLATSLQSLTLGLIPPTVDQVLVSSVTRSRVPDMEVVFLLGAVEGQFPKVLSEDPILSDAERAAFNAAAADPIGDGSDRQLLEMPFFDYVALTRARRRLIVSYPLADRRGKALGRSRHVARLRELLGGAVVERRFDAASRTHIDRIATLDDLLAGVASWARQETAATPPAPPAAPAPFDDDAALMPAVYNWLVTQTSASLTAARQQVWRGVAPRPAPHLHAALAAQFYPLAKPLRMSVSQLEKFAACPLQYFVYYTLGLRPRAEFQLDQLSLGQLQHGILERVYRRIIRQDIAWPACTPEALRALVYREVDATIAEQHREIAQRTPGYDKTRARLKRVLGLVLEADRRRALVGRFRPDAVELPFDQHAAPAHDPQGHLVSLPVLPFTTAGDRTLHLRGKIDRLDVVPGSNRGLVIDYKSGARKSMDLFRVLPGIALQLPVYALVMRDLAGLDPSAVLYVALSLPRERLEHAGDAVDADTDEFFHKLKPRGLVNDRSASFLDGQLTPDGGSTSPWYKLIFNKDGSPRKGTDLLAQPDFRTLLHFTQWKIATLADELADGKIAPEPFRCGTQTPCAYCEFASLCPFDQVRGTYREIRRDKPAESLDRMRRLIGAATEPEQSV